MFDIGAFRKAGTFAAILRWDVRVLQVLELITQNCILPFPSRSGFQSALIQKFYYAPHLRALLNFIEGEAQTRLRQLDAAKDTLTRVCALDRRQSHARLLLSEITGDLERPRARPPRA